MVSLVTRLLIVAAVYVPVVTVILLVRHASPTVFGILALWMIVPVGVSYLYWRPRYKAL